MSSARKREILRASEASMPEVGEVAEALHRIADELAGIGGALSYMGASKHSGTAGEQRILGGVIYHTAKQRFGGVKYDGELIDQATIDSLDKMFRKLLRKP